MAEVLSVAASIIAVLQLTGTVASLGYGYIGGVKRASKDLGELLKELGSLTSVLITLKDYVDANPCSPALQKLGGQDGPIHGCFRELEILQTKLEPRDGFKGIVDNLKWPLKDTETAQFISRIERHKSLFMLALTVDQIALTREIGESVQKTNLAVQDIQSESVDWRQKEEIFRMVAKRRTVLRWLSSEDFEKKHLEISNKRQHGTGKWLLERLQAHPGWGNGTPTSRLLWGFGIPGAGKTFLSSVVIDHFRDQAVTQNYGVAYIYFDYKERDQQRPTQVIASLAKQLAAQTTDPSLPTEIERLYEKLERQEKKPSTEELFGALLGTFKSFSQVFLVFDALDECNQDSQRRGLLPLFHRMGQSGANIFLTSRQHPEDIQQSFYDIPKLELSAQKEDIEIYIRQKIEENPRASRLIQRAKCHDRIVSELIDCAQGMFLLVHFHIAYLCQQTNAKQILITLDKLKSAVNDRPLYAIYDAAMKALRNQSESSAELGILILTWLAKSKASLSMEELRVAVSVEPDRYELDEFDLPETTTILDACAGLVMIDENTNTVRLIHYTVLEYLLENSIIPQDAEFKLAMACTTFLTFDIFAQGACTSEKSFRDRLESQPFLAYAVNHLNYHLAACDESLSSHMILKFLERPGSISSYLQAGRSKTPSDFNLYARSCTPLSIAASLGHLAVVELLLGQGTDYSATDNYGRTALDIAALGGYHAVVRLLIEKGADCTIRSQNGKTALHWAATKGHLAVVQLLIENGADCSIQDRNDRTALHWAAASGHLAVVQLLVESGADCSVQDLNGSTALDHAALNGHLAVIQLLMEKGADYSARDMDGPDALYYAALWGDHEVVQLLVEKWGTDRSTAALHLAAVDGSLAVVQLLVENGVDPSVQNQNGMTALHYAASRGHQELVQLLIEKGADTLARNLKGQTALLNAASSGRLAVAQLLIEKGPDCLVMVVDQGGRTALHWAALQGHQEVVQLLIEKGADISAQSHNRETALHWTALNGHQEVAQLLVEKGADPSALDYVGDTALHNAATGGHLAVSRLLIEKGADFSLQNSKGETALHRAALKGHQDIVQLLIENGANYSALDIKGNTALHSAAVDGHLAVIRLLIGKGADFSAQNLQGETALHYAAVNGQQEVVQLLIETGADPSVKSLTGATALHKAAYSERQAVPVVRFLIGLGVDLSVQNHKGQTALHWAASSGKLEVVQMLIEKGNDCSVTVQDHGGRTALHWAALNGHQEVVQLLIEKGADSSTQSHKGTTALHWAAMGGHQAVIRVLVEKGADYSTQDNDGDTALHCAAMNGHQAAVQQLVESGADCSMQNKKGRTALECATTYKQQEIVQLLHGKGVE